VIISAIFSLHCASQVINFNLQYSKSATFMKLGRHELIEGEGKTKWKRKMEIFLILMNGNEAN
jgi:hypothetical protein